jgi:hypothetical protein
LLFSILPFLQQSFILNDKDNKSSLSYMLILLPYMKIVPPNLTVTYAPHRDW